MKIIEASAHIVTSDGKNVSGALIALETFDINFRRWIKLATIRTTSKGIWQAKVTRLRAGASYAPQLRLTESGSSLPRVLAQGGFFSYSTSTTILFVDFGLVEQLKNSAYALQAFSSRFKNTKLTVAGKPKKRQVFISTAISGSTLAMQPSATAGATRTISATNTVPTTSSINTNTIPSVEASRILTAEFAVERRAFRANETKLNARLIESNQLLAAKTLEVNTNKEQMKSLASNLEIKIKSEAQLKRNIQKFELEAKRQTPIRDIAANIGTEIDAANKLMKSKKQPYQFGRIQLDLKGTVSTEGQTMSLINIVDLTNLNGVATPPGVKMELFPNKEPSEAIALVPVPNVIGLTETATRRILQAVGLQLESITQSMTEDSKTPIGQSIQQAPKAGQHISRGSNILVVFTAENSTLEEKS